MLTWRLADGPLKPPDFQDGAKSAPWLEQMTHITNIAALTLVIMGLLSLLIGTAIAVAGPRMGFRHAAEMGRGGILGGIVAGALAASGWGIINAAVAIFS